MIKLLLICLFLFSCSPKIKYEDFPTTAGDTSIESYDLLIFNPQIEMMLVFLWPKDLGTENEKEVIDIISRSRKISQDKEQYLKNLYTLNAQYNQKNCDCHSYGICDDDQIMNDDIALECEDITLRQEENDMILANLTLDHDYIKEKLTLIGATNIDVGVDEDYLDIGSYDLITKTLKLNKFGYLNTNDPIKFKVVPYKSTNMKAEFTFAIEGEVFSGDLGVSNRDYNVIFSGEIETSSGQRGLVYWEHLK